MQAWLAVIEKASEMWKAKVNDGEEQLVSFNNKENTQGALDGVEFDLDLVSNGQGSWHLIRDNRSWNVELLEANTAEKTCSLMVNGVTFTVTLKDRYDELLAKLGMDNLTSGAVKDLKAPMPGLVIDIHVSPGDEVKKGDPLLVLEAMKMENVLKAPVDSVIGDIPVNKGIAVEKNQVLIQFG